MKYVKASTWKWVHVWLSIFIAFDKGIIKKRTSCGTPPHAAPADILQENFCKQKDVKVYKEEKTSRIFKQQIVMMTKKSPA